MQDLDLAVVRLRMEHSVDERVAKVSAFEMSLGRVVIGDDERAEDRLAGRNRQGDMVQADAAPRCTRLLPLPFLVSHLRQILAQRYKKFRTYAKERRKKSRKMPSTRRRNCQEDNAESGEDVVYKTT